MPNTVTDQISRPRGRRWLRKGLPIGLAALLALGATTGPAVAAGLPTTADPIVTSLLPPTGHHKVGTVRMHLVDHNRVDPSVATHPVRELMIQFWYPATHTEDYPTAPYLPPLAAAHFLVTDQFPANLVLPATVGHTGAPADHRRGPRPILLYSPGGGADGALDTGLFEDLASHGYIVVALDDPYDSTEVEYPDGRLVAGLPGGGILSHTEREDLRAADASFVLDELTVLRNGGNPDAERAPLPKGLADSIDLSRVGIMGWSHGGGAAAVAMNNDPRFKAGIKLDGTFFGPEKDTGVTRPFLVLTHNGFTQPPDPIATFLAASTGPKFHLNLANSMHITFTDGEDIYADIGRALGQTTDEIASVIGRLDPTTADTDIRVSVRAFFDRFLRDRDNHLLDGPSPRFPDLQFPS